jgi:multidrug efflux pump subunit AcrB
VQTSLLDEKEGLILTLLKEKEENTSQDEDAVKEELEDLRYNYKQSVLLNVRYEQMLQALNVALPEDEDLNDQEAGL